MIWAIHNWMDKQAIKALEALSNVAMSIDGEWMQMDIQGRSKLDYKAMTRETVEIVTEKPARQITELDLFFAAAATVSVEIIESGLTIVNKPIRRKALSEEAVLNFKNLLRNNVHWTEACEITGISRKTGERINRGARYSKI